MFGRFLKPRWQHTNPDIRLKAIEHLCASEEADILAKLARGDASTLVRAAATGKLTDFNLLDEIFNQDSAPTVREAASMRIMALLAGTTADAPPHDTRLRLVRLTGNAEVLAHIATHSPDEACQQAAIERLDNAPLLYSLALEGPSEPVRVAAAQQIRSLSDLKRLAREGRDKRVVRIARDAAKALQDQQQQQDAESARVIQLADRFEQHARRRVDALYGPRLEQLEQQWQASSSVASPELATRVNEALNRCRAQLNELQEEHRRKALEETAAMERNAACKALYQLLGEACGETWGNQLGEMRSALATQQRRWEGASLQAQASADEQDAFENLTAAFQAMLDLASAASENSEDPEKLQALALQWPAEYARPPRLEAILKATSQKPEKIIKSGKPNPHRGLLIALKRELDKGNLRHANRLWHKAEAIIAEGDAQPLKRELEKLSDRRAELQDWHRFAAEPKKLELCEKMDQLKDSTMDAPQLASAIQALHEEWRSLMSSDQDEDQALWDRFKAATDIAYEPCKAHFAEQDAQRKANLAKRIELCRQLEGFIENQDWSKADWEGVWQIRQQAPKDWQRHHPVRFTDARDAQKRFSAALSTLDEQITEHSKLAEQEREQLIRQAEQISLDGDDLRNAIAQAQEIQKKWRNTPWLPPSRHRPLQKQFRKVIDQVFKARDQQKDAYKAEQAQKQVQIAAQLSALEEALDADFSESNAATLRETLQALDEATDGRLPTSVNRQVQQLRRRAQERLARLGDWQRWHQLQEQVEALTPSDSTDESALMLAVAFEALAGVPSPEPERQRRLAWQLEALPSAMKQQGFAVMDEMARLLNTYDGAITVTERQRLLNALAVLEPGNA
ncbi:DUF349 domain-containing protein [Alcanivorax sediminis]|uniref:DUF349 domain-containing protein n=1 Tax=Alcanivorax sediminis TaxID=2663008 RepID=A0A6N7LUB1_9GAMM|nr:DUF349 domain-containing protein [Alcanivorax sediminis]MQX54017.1 DUF349 domain-containing protein [Alcanivorax sediminis]